MICHITMDLQNGSNVSNVLVREITIWSQHNHKRGCYATVKNPSLCWFLLGCSEHFHRDCAVAPAAGR